MRQAGASCRRTELALRERLHQLETRVGELHTVVKSEAAEQKATLRKLSTAVASSDAGSSAGAAANVGTSA